ncbi:hypothetical protein OG558_09555 [Kribbella sp. NBC_01510]|uniref:hypothetical protein n=1 Tax=Kribbella sp. NBC_01510 TaxID=2903581 RepID=UPI00386781B4
MPSSPYKLEHQLLGGEPGRMQEKQCEYFGPPQGECDLAAADDRDRLTGTEQHQPE